MLASLIVKLTIHKIPLHLKILSYILNMYDYQGIIANHKLNEFYILNRRLKNDTNSLKDF